MEEPLEKRLKERGVFILEGVNDRSKPCLIDGCQGYTHPIDNANMGVCGVCHQRIAWIVYARLEKIGEKD